MSQSFSFNLAGQKPPVDVPGGSIQEGNAGTFPVLDGLAAYIVTLDPGGVRIPHWHPDCNEMQYLISGSDVQVGLITPANGVKPGTDKSYTLRGPGWVGFIPQGWHHYIQNTGTEPAVMMIFFNNASPNDVDVSWALKIGGRDGRKVMEQVFGISLKDADFKRIWNAPGTPGGTRPSSEFGFDLGASHPQIVIGGSTIRQAVQPTFPVLRGMGLLLLTLEPGAALVPHWHPNAVELDYVLSGEVYMGLMTTAQGQKPGADVSARLEPGMVGFIPLNWFHYLHNTGSEPARVLVLLNSEAPEEVDISWAFRTGGADGERVLKDVFGISWQGADFKQIWISPPPQDS
ncbi:MAG TPA: cupin domain-containing protein [Longimicrobium sp.]|jgi:oxalate decarboxylase|uniref:cupin domain-containing protein n=1 Tax=Longimicrobium sp. TaxID=2029185 RepID=UPI002ED7EFD8